MATYTSPTDVTAGSLAKATDLNNIDAAVAAAFALLPTNAAINTGTVNYAVDTGTANAYLVALPTTATEYLDGMAVTMKPLNNNTGASTINVDSLGVKSIKTTLGEDPGANEIVAGIPLELRYSTTLSYFCMVQSSTASAATAAISAAAASVSASAASASASAAGVSAAAAAASASAAGVSAAAAAAAVSGHAATASSTTASGHIEVAINTEVDTGSDATRAVSPDSLAGSTIFGRKVVQVIVFGPTTDITTGDGAAYFVVPDELNGMNLVRASGTVITAGTTGSTTIQINNVTDAVDMLTVPLTIETGETSTRTSATPGTIDTAHDDVATGDVLRFDVDSVSTTVPQGLIIELAFQLP